MAVGLKELIDIYAGIARDEKVDAKDRLIAAERIEKLRDQMRRTSRKRPASGSQAASKSGDLLGKAGS